MEKNKITIRKKTALIHLPNGYFSEIDIEDILKIKYKRWYSSPRGNTRYCRYNIWKNGTCHTIQLPHVLINVPSGKVVDHINGNGLDNRKENLRICSFAENRMNIHKKSKTLSRFKGVTFHGKMGKWQAQIKHNNINHYLGLYITQKKAAAAYNNAAISIFGKYANLNNMEQA